MNTRAVVNTARASVLFGVAAVLYPVILFLLRGTWCYRNEGGQILPYLIPACVSLSLAVMAVARHSGGKTTFLVACVAIAIAIAALVMADRRRSFMNQRAQMIACIGNLRMLDSAKEQWAMTRSADNGTVSVTNEVTTYIMGDTMPLCPAGRRSTYSLGKIGEDPSCSIHGPMFKTHLPDGTNPWE
jgi:hypothetical protein